MTTDANVTLAEAARRLAQETRAVYQLEEDLKAGRTSVHVSLAWWEALRAVLAASPAAEQEQPPEPLPPLADIEQELDWIDYAGRALSRDARGMSVHIEDALLKIAEHRKRMLALLRRHVGGGE